MLGSRERQRPRKRDRLQEVLQVQTRGYQREGHRERKSLSVINYVFYLVF